MDTMEREKLKLRLLLNQDTTIMDTVIMVMDIMDTMEREKLKLRLLLNQDTTIVDTAIMVMDIMDTMERERLSLDITIMDMVMDMVMGMDIMDEEYKMIKEFFNTYLNFKNK